MKKLLFALITACCLLSCKRDTVPNGEMSAGFITISFDDNAVANWNEYLPLLDSLGMKATFYACRYHELNAAQKTELHNIESHGDEIAFHTTTHSDMVKALSKSGMDNLLKTEVKEELEK
ncbi:MAG: polysaccharide deacetylase family protein [Chitinophagaceae bacterium]|nr:polysaccharide deacetylase family protein [Chitinophagaceae bacterium]